MKTNLEFFQEETGLKLLGETTVWDFHSVVIDNVAMRKNSNLNYVLNELKKKGVKGMVTLYVHSIGWSKHSASAVAIFEGVTNADSCHNYYSSRIGEVRMDRI